MNTRFVEAEDLARTNHGKFFLLQLGPEDQKVRSRITQAPLLASLPPVRRFGGPLKAGDVLLVDLQTQEGFFFDPDAGEDALRRRFLVHPLHVCILFFPLMRLLASAHEKGALWKLPGLVSIDLEDVMNQPGLLVDAAGRPVRGVFEWTRRTPIVARFRNRAVEDAWAEAEAAQGELTAEEQAENAGAVRPVW